MVEFGDVPVALRTDRARRRADSPVHNTIRHEDANEAAHSKMSSLLSLAADNGNDGTFARFDCGDGIGGGRRLGVVDVGDAR